MGVKAVFNKVKDNLPFWNEKLPEIPDLVYDYLKTNREAQRLQLTTLKQIQQQQQQHNKKVTLLVIIATLAICLTISFT